MLDILVQRLGESRGEVGSLRSQVDIDIKLEGADVRANRKTKQVMGVSERREKKEGRRLLELILASSHHLFVVTG